MEKNKFYKIVVEFTEKCGLEYDETKELYKICLDEITENCNNISKYYSKGMLNDVKSELHNIKGVSGSYLLESVYNISKLISEYVEVGSKLRFAVAVSDLKNELSDIRNNIDIVFNELELKSPKSQ
ncbi:MAG: Hpt domain-containing protein [Clostridiales bacterium]